MRTLAGCISTDLAPLLPIRLDHDEIEDPGIQLILLVKDIESASRNLGLFEVNAGSLLVNRINKVSLSLEERGYIWVRKN